jgi:lactoylglutathione lyase
MAESLKVAETILYVASPAATAKLFETAFGFTVGYIHDGDLYANLKSGTEPGRLSFASHAWANGNHGKGKIGFSTAGGKAPGSEVCLSTDDVDASFARAVKAGFKSFKEPYDTPWGSRMAYLRDPTDGHVVSFSANTKKAEEPAPAAETKTKATPKKGKAAAAAPAEKKGVKATTPAKSPAAKHAASDTKAPTPKKTPVVKKPVKGKSKK